MSQRIVLNSKNNTIKIVNRNHNIRLQHTGKVGPQGPQGIPGDPASNIVTSVNTQIGDVVLDANDVGAVYLTTTVNGHALNSDVTVIASDVPFASDANISADNVQGAITELRDDTLAELDLKSSVADVNYGLSLKEDTANKDPSTTLGTSDLFFPTQNAVKVYVDNAIGGIPGDSVTSVNGQTGVVVLDTDDLIDTSSAHKFVTAADITKLSNLSGVNTGDQDLSPYELLSNKSTSTSLGASNTLYPTQAAVKSYVDSAVSGVPIGNYVLKAGDTMTGTLTGRSLEPSANLTYNLGTTNYYAEIRARRVYFNATSYIDGTTAGTAALNGSLTVGTNLTVSGSTFLAGTQINSSLAIPLSIVSNMTSGAGAGAGIVALSNDGAALASADRMGFMLFGGSYDTTNTFNGAGFVAYTAEAWSATNRGTSIDVEVTVNGTAARTVALRIGNDKVVKFFADHIPNSNLIYSVGSASAYFSNLYAQRHNFNSTAYMDGAVAGTINIGAGNFGIAATGGSAPFALTLGSTAVATGIALFNTSDQTTNTEKLNIYFATNVARIRTSATGTGTARALQIGSGNRLLDVSDGSGSTNSFSFYSITTMGLQPLVTIADGASGGLFTNSTGVATPLRVIPTYNQTSTASSTDILVNRTQTAVGSGIHNFIDMQVAGVSKTRIDNTGSHILSSGGTITLFNTTDETTNYERLRMYWSGNTAFLSTEQGGSAGFRVLRITSASDLFVASGATTIALQNGSSTSKITLTSSITSVAPYALQHLSALSASSIIQYGFAILPTLTQTGTAGYTALLVNPTETTTGSGSRMLADFQVGGSSKLSINFAGSLTTGGFVSGGQLVPTSSSVPTRGIYLPAANTLGFATNSILQLSIDATGNQTIVEGGNIILGTTTGTKIGTATTQKLAFYNTTPRVQGAAITDATGTIGSVQSQLNLLLAFMRSWGAIAP